MKLIPSEIIPFSREDKEKLPKERKEEFDKNIQNKSHSQSKRCIIPTKGYFLNRILL